MNNSGRFPGDRCPKSARKITGALVAAVLLGGVFYIAVGWSGYIHALVFIPETLWFNSQQEAVARVERDLGVRWPGTTTTVKRAGDGLVIERRWLGVVEATGTVEPETIEHPPGTWMADQARYVRGPGDRLQQAVVGIVSLGTATLLVFGAIGLFRRARPRLP